MVRIPRLSKEEGVVADLLLKLEFFNPLGPVKDRIALGMMLDMENDGRIEPGKTTLVEPTSGNTGIGLAFVAASRGYKLILTMPESMSLERKKMLAILGAQVELTPKEKGMRGAIEKANEFLATIPGSVMPSQFDNPSNPAIHERTTAEEIWKDTNGEVDAIISGVGTGGTFTGCARTLKPRKPSLKMIAVEPEKSPVLSGGQPEPAPDPGHRGRLHPRQHGHQLYRRDPAHQHGAFDRSRAQDRQDRGHSGRHVLRRSDRCRHRSRQATGDEGQDDRA